MRPQWTVLGGLLMTTLLGGMIGCDRQSEETRQAVRRAEKAEKRVQTLGQTVETLTAQKKDLELEIMALTEAVNRVQSGIEESTEANSSLDMQLQQVKAQNTSLAAQLTELRTEIRDKDRHIRELEALVKALADTVPEADAAIVDMPVIDTMDTAEANMATDDVVE